MQFNLRVSLQDDYREQDSGPRHRSRVPESGFDGLNQSSTADTGRDSITVALCAIAPNTPGWVWITFSENISSDFMVEYYNIFAWAYLCWLDDAFETDTGERAALLSVRGLPAMMYSVDEMLKGFF